MERIIDTSYGEVSVDCNGDCYIGDCYDTYIGTINHKGNQATLAKRIEKMIKDGDGGCDMPTGCWNDCEVNYKIKTT